ncbi:MAG: YfhO family protein [Phycisphaerales bacterium]|nr:YfhO family protein [Phycisphaerales bacterium]
MMSKEFDSQTGYFEHGPALPSLMPGGSMGWLVRGRRVLVSGLIVLLPVVLLAGAWRLGGFSALEDDLLYYLPIRQYIGERIAAGEWPLWNPQVGMGTSLAGDPQSGLWYPATLLFAILPPREAYSVGLIAHFALAGAGMYRFLRASKLDWRAALLGAIAFEFSGFLVAHRAHLTILQAAAWLPWMLYAWRRFADTGRYRPFALASFCFGLQMLVQHMQVSIISVLLLSGYVMMVLWPRRRGLWWAYPAGMGLGAALAAVQILPTWFYFAGSGRASPAYYLFVENSWSPTSTLLLLFPMIFGARTPNFWDQGWWGLSHFCEQSAYASILILVLAVASLGLVRRHREMAFWWLACLVAMLLALGDTTPISTPISKLLFHVPVYHNLRVPARWILVWSIAWPILAATVVSILLRRGPECTRMMLWIRKSAGRVLPAAATVCVLVLVTARLAEGRLAAHFTSDYARPVLEGLRSAVRVGNPAIWWPIILMVITAWVVIRWANTRRDNLFVAMTVLLVVDLASVAGFVDMDTRTYRRAALDKPPPLAEAIQQLKPRPGERLLVPRYSADYHRPVEVLWPQTNMLFFGHTTDSPSEDVHAISTFNGYGPFWPVEQRQLFRFQPWGSSEEMLGLLLNDRLLQAMGVRFIAVRSDEERMLLKSASLPTVVTREPDIIPGTEDMAPVRYGADLLWPVRIDAPGVYALSFEAEPAAGSASRWFVRVESEQAEALARTRTLDPMDLALGRRRMRFHFAFNQIFPTARIRVKAEMGLALSAGKARWARVAGPDGTGCRPDYVHRADLPGGVSLYELPGTVGLVRWVDRFKRVADTTEAVERLLHDPDSVGLPEAVLVTARGNTSAPAPETGMECTKDGMTVHEPEDAWSRPAILRWTHDHGHEIRVTAHADRPGLLVFNESFVPGWRAELDGRPVHMERVNGVCQGVEVSGGQHEVRFFYRPPGLYWGLAISLLTLLALLSGCILRRSRPWNRAGLTSASELELFLTPWRNKKMTGFRVRGRLRL